MRTAIICCVMFYQVRRRGERICSSVRNRRCIIVEKKKKKKRNNVMFVTSLVGNRSLSGGRTIFLAVSTILFVLLLIGNDVIW